MVEVAFLPDGTVPGGGPMHPATTTPARRPNSIRRTTTHDFHHSDGRYGEVVHESRGRDLWTGADGVGQLLASAGIDAVIDKANGDTLRSLRSSPQAPELSALVGRRASSGFRQGVDDALADEDRTASLRYQLLDDLPIALIVSGVTAALTAAPPAGYSLRSRVGICAGFAGTGELLRIGDSIGHAPIATGPTAPDLGSPADPLAWHEVRTLGRMDFRRRRRIDVWREADHWAVEAFFRDSRTDADGLEVIVHEYTLHATLTHEPLTFTTCEATLGVLPWFECPGALTSAHRLVGSSPHDLRDRIRSSFTGTTTCTHLNDSLRSLAPLPHFAAVIAAATGR